MHNCVMPVAQQNGLYKVSQNELKINKDGIKDGYISVLELQERVKVMLNWQMPVMSM